MNIIQTRSVPTNSLKVGDVFIAYGGLFRVVEVIVSQCHGDIADNGGGEVHANKSEFLGHAYDDAECAIPAHWRDGRAPYGLWNQQGNRFATTSLVTDAEVLEALNAAAAI